MKRNVPIISLAISILIIGGCDHGQNDLSVLEGAYMGQTPPGKTAEVFAPGVISTDGWELEAVFAPGMKEFYYVTDSGKHERPKISELEPTIYGYRLDNNRWHKFTEMPRTGEPFITADGQTMHLAKGRRVRTASGWSDVESLGPMFEREDWGIMRLTASMDGTYVFDDFKSGGLLRVSRVVDGERQEPIELPEHINRGEFTAHPFIADNESYLIWDSEREGGYGESDLYISFRQADKSWGPAINMGPDINSDKDDFYGSVTPDGKFLMFNRTISRSDDYIDVDIYWADAQFIEGLRRESESHALNASPYLGQTPPGLTPVPFAPGLVNTEEWGDGIIFFPDMNEICVVRWKHTADAPEPENVIFERADNAWRKRSAPEGYCRPSLSPDGNTLYYRAKYKERTADGWSEFKSLGPAFEDIRIMGLMSSAKGTLVFDEIGTIIPDVGATGDGLIRYSRLVDGVREEPTPFGKEINTGTWNAHPFIAPDESYIMWDGERDTGYGDSDVYISFRQQDGSWGEAINLGDKVNTDAEEGGAKITPDGKYLFFNRMVPGTLGDTALQSDLYWVSAEFIEDLRPGE